jgi:hypothetical protein
MAFLNNISNRVGSTINNQLGKGINSLIGSSFPAEDIPLYEDFLYNILADADNAVTESSYWVCFFTIGTNTPTTLKSSIRSLISKYASQEFGITTGNASIFKDRTFNLDPNPWIVGEKTGNAKDQFENNLKNAMMLVQGVEIPGDSFGVTRQGEMNVGGFLRPAIGQARDDMPEMNITFLENNSSITDLVLRPWVIHSSYASLKFAVKGTITCYNLTRSPSGFRVRKQFKFYNAVPMSIDSEQYDYSSASSFGKRQVKFVFSHYDINEGSAMKDSIGDAVGNFILQKTRNFATSVVESGVDVLAGGANQVFTNVKGAFVDSVNDHLQDVQTRIREYGKDAEDSIIDSSQRTIDKLIGFNPDKDSLQGPGTEFSTEGVGNNPSPRIPVDAQSDDKLASPPVPPKSSGVTNNAQYRIVKINGSDTVDSQALNTQEVVINNSSEGLQTIPTVVPTNDNIRR